MYIALLSFTTNTYDVRRKQILADDFTTQAEIQEFLRIGYIQEYNGTLEITENGEYDVKDYETADVDVAGGQAILQRKNVTINDNGTTNVAPDEGYDGLSEVEITTNINVFPPNWSEIGYNGTPQDILNGFNYAKQIYQNWDPMDYDLRNKYREDSSLVYLPALTVDTEVSFVDMVNFCKECNNLKAVGTIEIQHAEEVDISEAFTYCGQLVSIEFLNIMNISRADDIFNSCSSLSDDTLSMIMYVLAYNTIEDYQGTKTLNAIGFDNSQIARCRNLQYYQDLMDAGWLEG